MIYNISFDVCGVIVLSLILLILQKFYEINSKSSKLFRRFIIFSIFSGLLDIATAFSISYSQNILEPINLILNTFYLFSATLTTYSAAIYMFSTIKIKSSIHKIYNRFVLFSYLAILIINLFTGIVFDFKGRTYNHGPFYMITFLQSFFIIFYFTFFMIFNYKLFSKKQLLIFSSFLASPIIFVTFQIAFPNNLMTVFAEASSALLMLFAVETPDFVELERLKKNLEHEVQMRTKDLEKSNSELERKNFQAKQDMELAAHLQQVLFPHKFNFPGWDIGIRFLPLSGISGDLYDFYEFDGLLRGVGLFDVSGHGISSGLVTVLAKDTIFHEFKNTMSINLSEAMYKINDAVVRIKGEIENYMTGIICRIDKEDSSKVEIVNAGSPYPVYKSKNKKQASLITPDKEKSQYGMIGIAELDVCFQTIKQKMNIGDALVFYTDGITESENENGEQYGVERLQNIIENIEGSAQEIIDAIFDDLHKFMGDKEFSDDLTVIVLKRTKKNLDLDIVEELESVE